MGVPLCSTGLPRCLAMLAPGRQPCLNGDMTTMPIREYAKKHGLSADSIAETFSEQLEQDLTADDAVEITELDDFREMVFGAAIDELRDAAEGVADATEDLRNANNNLRRSVQEALEDGLPAARVAQVLGVSRARVYQIRDGKR